MKIPPESLETAPAGSSTVEFWNADTKETIYEATISALPRVGEQVDLSQGNGSQGLGVYHVLQTRWCFVGDGHPIVRIKLRSIEAV